MVVPGGRLLAQCSPVMTNKFAYRVRASGAGLDAVSILSPEEVAQVELGLRVPEVAAEIKPGLPDKVLESISCTGGDVKECARSTLQAPQPLNAQHWCLVLFNVHSGESVETLVDAVWDQESAAFASSSSLVTPPGPGKLLFLGAMSLAGRWIS